MTTKFVSPFKDGATIQVAYGVLRGVGPMGPRGHTGAQGPPGPQGIPGPQPELLPVAGRFETTDAVYISNTGSWVTIPLLSNTYLVGDVAGLNLSNGSVVIQGAGDLGASIIFTPKITISPAAGDTADVVFEVGLFSGAAGSPFTSNTFRHARGASAADYVFTSQNLMANNSEVFLKVRVWATVSPLVSFASLRLARTGGPDGPKGSKGDQGDIGPQGVQGIAGNSGTGYATLDTVDSAGDSDVLPAGSLTTSQGLTYPTGAMAPAIPAYFKSLADAASKWIVRRFTSTTDVLVAPDMAVGQVNYITSNGSFVGVVNVTGTTKTATIAQVMYGTSDPPAGIHPAGTIYLKVL